MTNEAINAQSSQSNEDQPILRGLVADILNEREVIINLGTRDGVKKRMRFAVIEELKYEVTDPETDEVLGILPPREKIRVEVHQVEEKMCVAATYQERRVRVGGEGTLYSSVDLMLRRGEPAKYVNKPYTFRVGEGGKIHFKKIRPEDSIVYVGDHVIQIIEEQEIVDE